MRVFRSLPSHGTGPARRCHVRAQVTILSGHPLLPKGGSGRVRSGLSVTVWIYRFARFVKPHHRGGVARSEPPAPVRTSSHHPFVQPYSYSLRFDFRTFLENRRLRSCEFESRTLRHLFPFVCNGHWAVGARSPDFAEVPRGVSGPSTPTSLRLVLPCPASLFRSPGEVHPLAAQKSDWLG